MFSPLTFKQFISTLTPPQVERAPSLDPYDTDIRDQLERSGLAHLTHHDEVKTLVLLSTVENV